MASGVLTIDLSAVVANWRALDALSSGETAAVVKADAYGLGIAPVAKALAAAGVRSFCVATAAEGSALRQVLGAGPVIYVFSGHMAGDTLEISSQGLTPLLSSPEQVQRHQSALPGHAYGLQLDSGMNRLGIEPEDFAGMDASGAVLVMSHLACADEPEHPMNAQQLACFCEMTAHVTAPRSLAATGGTLLGKEYHFDMTRPGVGLYGGLPFAEARPVVQLELPVVQTRRVKAGETVGYGNTWRADSDALIATVSGGYADGLIRAMSDSATLWAGETPCPLVGRVSMDLITVDVTHLPESPDALSIISPLQPIDSLSDSAGTIGYEILTGLGQRYERRYI